MAEVVVGASEDGGGAVDGTDERETGAAAGVPSTVAEGTDCWAGERIEPETL